jgi:hypothetical protein
LGALAQEQPTGSWPSAESYSTGNYFYGGGSASDGTYLYLLGGWATYPSHFRRYDPVSNSMIDLTDLPEPNVNFRAAFSNGRVYILGNGYYGNGDIYAHEISTGAWQGSLGTLSNGRYGAGGAVLGDKIYVGGGIDPNQGYTSLMDEFDTTNQTVTARASMPVALRLPVAVGFSDGNRAFFMGGQGDAGISAACLEYDPAANQWTTRATMSINGSPQPRLYAGGFVLGSRIYVVGGYENDAQPTTLEYSPLVNAWVQRASMNYGRYGQGFGVIDGKAYVFGGWSNGGYDVREQFVPPDFGSGPDLPASVRQVGSQATSSSQGGWTNNQLSFEAEITDPDPGQLVRLEVQVRASGSQSWGPILSSGNGAQGTRSINFVIPADGQYDWRWRVADTFNNYTPSVNGVPAWIEGFDNAVSPDFRSDQIPPAIPIAVSPADVDIQVTDPSAGPVSLTWVESTDNGPQDAITYEIQVAREGGFGDIEAQIFSTAGNSSVGVPLAVDRNEKFWRLRAKDVGGNYSGWSNVRTFRVTYNDGANHSSGDAKRVCGFSAGAAVSSMTGALLGLAVLAMAAGRRLVRK